MAQHSQYLKLFYEPLTQNNRGVLARLLDIEDPELSKALSRLVDLLTPSMAAEEEPLARRKQELLLNNVSIGGRLQLIVRARRALILDSTYFICHIIYELCSGFKAPVELGKRWC